MTALDSTKNLNGWKKRLLFLVVAATVGALTVLFLWLADPNVENWKDRFYQVLDFLEANPWALMAAVAILPGIGFPLSPLLVFFGIALAPRFGMPLTCLLGIFSQSICTTWTYLLASGPLREALRRMITKHRELPEPTQENMVQMGVILRITPGIPYPLQNIVLGILGMRLRPYLMVSLPITSIWTVAFIVTGGAIFEGQAGLAISGILLLVVLILLTKMFQRRTRTHAG